MGFKQKVVLPELWKSNEASGKLDEKAIIPQKML